MVLHNTSNIFYSNSFPIHALLYQEVNFISLDVYAQQLNTFYYTTMFRQYSDVMCILL